MRIPQSPPSVFDLLSDVQGVLPIPKLPGGQYLHWDKLRHLKPPAGMTTRKWWLQLKIARQGMSRATPLVDTHGQPFGYCLVDPIPEKLHFFDVNAAGSFTGPIQGITPENRDRYLISTLIEEAITSSQLEGAATTRRVAEAMLRRGRRPRDVHEQMILNNFLTMQRVREIKDESLTPELLLELHRCVTESTLKESNASGRFRREDEKIEVADEHDQILFTPPSASLIDERVCRLCRYANERKSDPFLHPVLRAIILHFWLAYEHPFVDGNGRVARALFYWCMLRNGYWLAEYVSISQVIRSSPAKYGRAFLHTETDENDLTYFILYHLKILERAVDEVHRYVRSKADEVTRFERRVRRAEQFNYRQQAMIIHALRHPNFEYTVQSHRLSHDVVYQTARTDLLGLVKMKLLTARKRGRTYYFSPVSDLASKLAKI